MPVSIWIAASRRVRVARAAADQPAISASEFSTGVRRWLMRAGTASGCAPSRTKIRASGTSGRKRESLLQPGDEERVATGLDQRGHDLRHARSVSVGFHHGGGHGGPGKPLGGLEIGGNGAQTHRQARRFEIRDFGVVRPVHGSGTMPPRPPRVKACPLRRTAHCGPPP